MAKGDLIHDSQQNFLQFSGPFPSHCPFPLAHEVAATLNPSLPSDADSLFWLCLLPSFLSH